MSGGGIWMQDRGPWGGKPASEPPAPRKPPSRTAVAILVSIVAAGAVALAWMFMRGSVKSDDERRFDADYRTCIRSESAEVQRAACSRLIVSGWLKDRSLSMVYNNRGVAYWRLDRFEEALIDYNWALHLDRDNALAHLNKGNAHAFRKEFESAIASYRQAIAIDPEYADAYSNLGNALWELNRFSDALRAYDDAIGIAPESPGPYHFKARLLMRMKRYDEAVANFDRILQLRPRDAQARYGRGICWERLGEVAKAEADYAEARKLDPRIVADEKERAASNP